MNRTFLRNGSALAASVLVLAVYAAALILLPRHVFWHPDDGAKFIETRSLHWDRGLVYKLPYRGATRDPGLAFYPSRSAGDRLYPAPAADGSLRFHWPIWFPLVSAAALAALGLTGLYVVPLLCGWLTAIVAGRWAHAHHPSLAPIAIILTGLGTPICFYSLCFSEHTLATLCGVVALSSAIGVRSRRWASALVIPLLLAAIVLRLEMIAFAAAVLVGWAGASVAAARRPAGEQRTMRGGPGASHSHSRRWAFRILIAVAVLLPLLAMVASIVPRHWKALALVPELLLRSRFKLVFLPDVVRQVFINAGGLGAPLTERPAEFVALGALALCFLAPFLPWRRVEAAVLLPSLAVLTQFSLAMAMASRPYIARQGIFAITPHLAVALYVLPHAWRARRHALFGLACAAVSYLAFGFAAIFSTRVTLDGIYQVGLEGAARYLLTLCPLWTALSVIALHIYRQSDRPALGKSAFTALVAAMMLVAMLYQVRGLRMLNDNRQLIAKWEAALPRHEPVVTNVWWLPAAVGPFFVDHEMYCLPQPVALSRWIETAGGRGVDTFTYVSRDEIDAGRFAPASALVETQESRFVEGMRLSRFRVARAAGRP